VIHYVQGDATDPNVKTGHRYILHITNDRGTWGAGFVLALSAKWPAPEREYRTHKPVLGTYQVVPVSNDITVINMCAQAMHGNHRVRYWALNVCLANIGEQLSMERNISVHMPRIGCGLGGGVWEDIEYFINAHISCISDVYVYDL